jgi:hypothetical protein
MPNAKGQFQRGEHWRTPQPYWDRAWLDHEYTAERRSASDIAAQFAITENSILFWLGKHGIPRRSISEIRERKHWGLAGAANPMYGKVGILNPRWKGGLTPARQAIYASSDWKSAARAVRKRDKACRLCGCCKDTEIHHIDPFSQAPLLVMDVGNMILLCGACHRKMRGKENRWKKRLFRLIGERG